jgi:hypothetical protein
MIPRLRTEKLKIMQKSNMICFLSMLSIKRSIAVDTFYSLQEGLNHESLSNAKPS